MTKQNEIDILSAAIKQLGPDSYLGPWLAQIKAGIVDLVKNNIFPDITLNDAIKSCDSIRLHAIADAEGIIADARAKADKIEKAADRHRETVAEAIRAASLGLERW